MPSNPTACQWPVPIYRQCSCCPDMIEAELPWPPIIIIVGNEMRSEIVRSPRLHNAALTGSPKQFNQNLLPVVSIRASVKGRTASADAGDVIAQ